MVAVLTRLKTGYLRVYKAKANSTEFAVQSSYDGHFFDRQ